MKFTHLKYPVILAIIFLLSVAGRYTDYSEKILTGKSSIQLAVTGTSNNLELNSDHSRPVNQGEKVEPTVIPVPVSKSSELRRFALPDLQYNICSGKTYSLLSHFYLVSSNTVNLSSLVNILRI